MNFPTDISSILERITEINPIKYASTRNFKDGAVTYLSPYISRGVISTNQVAKHLYKLNLEWHTIEKLVQELAWRDYWQLIWIDKKNQINQDLKNEQKPILNHAIPKVIFEANTGINEVDNAIKALYATGYMHNHMRMYVASICCNIAKSHWLNPAKWMYGHLLDGDVASNNLSWQWIAGAFSNKKYYANQNNINKYFNSNQKNTFLDIDYSDFECLETTKNLTETVDFKIKTEFNTSYTNQIETNKTTLVYNYYNIDPEWHKNKNYQRILLLEPSHFEKHPITQKCLDFALDLSINIKNLKVFVGEFSTLNEMTKTNDVIFKEHPTNNHYKGIKEDREWLSNVKGFHPSFFSYWKNVKKKLNNN